MTVVSVGHRPALKRFHSVLLTLRPDAYGHPSESNAQGGAGKGMDGVGGWRVDVLEQGEAAMAGAAAGPGVKS